MKMRDTRKKLYLHYLRRTHEPMKEQFAVQASVNKSVSCVSGHEQGISDPCLDVRTIILNLN